MKYTYKKNLPPYLKEEDVLRLIESELKNNNFAVERKQNKLFFDRLTTKKGADRFQIISELFKNFSVGDFYIEEKSLVCRINYLKQIIISLLLGLVIGLMFSWLNDFDLLLILKIMLPISSFFIIKGWIVGGNWIRDFADDIFVKLKHQCRSVN